MKKRSLFLALVCINLTFAQSVQINKLEDIPGKYSVKRNFSPPLILVDGKIANTNFLRSNSALIESVQVYKSATNLPDFIKHFSDLVNNGIIDVRMKENQNKFRSIALSELNRKYNLPENEPVYFENMKISDPKTEILEDLLVDIEVKEEKGEKLLLIYSRPKVNPEIKL